MKLKLFTNSLLTLVLVLSFSTLVFATTGTQISKDVEGGKANLTFTTEKLKTGSNEFTLSILDSNGEAIPVTNLQVTADMDRSTDMGNDGMEKDAPMMIDLKDGSQKGEYTGMVDLKNHGKWIMNATFDLNGQTQSVDFDFTIPSADPSWLIIGGFSAVIVIIILIAAIGKKKSIKS